MPIGSASLSSPLLARRDWHYRACLAITGFYQQMDVRLLEAFRAVVDHRFVTQAAAAMRVTQPAVSEQITPFSTWASSPARSSLPSTTRLAPFVRDWEPSILAQSFLSMLVDKLGPLYA
jgi:Bacterial regulatory helix-turn-helix protein, lysR family